MALVHQIQIFLKKKLEETKLKKKDLAYKIDIPCSTLSKIINAVRDNPKLITILKIANYFKCSIDEVVGRSDYTLPYQKIQEFLNVSPKDISTNLREFVKRKLKQQELSIYVLSKNIGSSEETLPQFMKDNGKQKILGSAVIVSLADYFQVSLDEMVGRIKPTTSDNSEPSQQSSSSDTEVK
ncbi:MULTISPECIES: helix-turn-helix domain-containing protein [unclassified Candidatus Tisiphia]|uniref:helix-turn-helix domain-containing protein n=1 Tax=unclassified Candidatus Tisiphia TaxID=2996318 RepID=UPI00312C938C